MYLMHHYKRFRNHDIRLGRGSLPTTTEPRASARAKSAGVSCVPLERRAAQSPGWSLAVPRTRRGPCISPARSSLKNRPALIAAVAAGLGLVRPSLAQQHVSDTVHNLSVSGPGEVRAQAERQVCIFCHAPHNTSGLRPLWNREVPAANYRIYRSSTLDAKPGQPTGASKLCLSCHDGTIALGSVLSRADRIQMRTGDFMPAGLTNLGTDLSDDHPVSFFYTASLAVEDGQLADPHALPHEIRLEANGELQCTACHDAHNNTYGDFLVTPDEFGELCTSCHRMNGWPGASHRQSSASVAGHSEGAWPYETVAQNACRSCHRPHTAGGRERLLIFNDEEKNCLICHDGRVAAADIQAQIDKPSAHDPRRYSGKHDPAEGALADVAHVECADCHNAHAATAASSDVRYLPLGGTLEMMPGVSVNGTTLRRAQFEYEVCFRCHADTAVEVPKRIGRQSPISNLRLLFQPSSASSHPVVVSSSSMESPSLVPGLTPGSMIRCTDCHNNDGGPRAGGGGPDGPHGSIYDFLLERNYTVTDDTVESTDAYALCYKCHERTSILANESFSAHRLHIVDERTPCSACHAPHGVSNLGPGGRGDHTRLINFDTTIVRPDPQSGRLEFRDTGRLSGTCTMVCHGTTHREQAYP